jgi:hypothetical protein
MREREELKDKTLTFYRQTILSLSIVKRRC